MLKYRGHKRTGKIYDRYTPAEYAEVLRERHGDNAGPVASNRYDRTEDPQAAAFYDRVTAVLCGQASG